MVDSQSKIVANNVYQELKHMGCSRKSDACYFTCCGYLSMQLVMAVGFCTQNEKMNAV